MGPDIIDCHRGEPYGVIDEWGVDVQQDTFSYVDTDATNQWNACFSQIQPQILETGFDFDPVPLLARSSEDRINPMELPGRTSSPTYATDTPVVSDGLGAQAPSKKRGSTGLSPAKQQSKRSKQHVACARCWVLKRKVCDHDIIKPLVSTSFR